MSTASARHPSAQSQPHASPPAGSQEPRNAPVQEIRIGRIKATVWPNETQNGRRYNTTFARLYRVEDQWRETQSFGGDDLPLLAKVADQVHSWISANASAAAAEQNDVPF